MKKLTKELFLAMVDDYIAGRATAGEKEFLERYYAHFSDEPDVLEQLSEEEKETISKRMHAGIDQRVKERGDEQQSDQIVAVPHIPIYRQRWMQVAAAFTIVLSMVFYFTRQSDENRFVGVNHATSDIAPGGNKAILTLSNGSKISLSEATKGKIADPNGASINNATNGQLVYNANAAATGAELSYNTIETRNGGQYQLVLPDGTKVWINSASSLKYPISFNGNERVVQLSGEAYFEVFKNKAKPFKVITDKQQVTVLGTHFNINAYSNELLTKTTLIEGSVKVNKISSEISVVLKPGQQASVKDGSGVSAIQTETVDIDEATAWKNGYFMFDNESLESILRKVSRWYDVDIVNNDVQSSRKRFSGTISRYSNVSQVLKKLELTESVKFKIEGRKIMVMP